MHYFSFNISDYMSHTGHLTEMEDLAYLRLLQIYYLHEKPLPKEIDCVARLVRMPNYQTEVEKILKEFFKLKRGKGWVNARADEELQKYRSRVQNASRAGKASALAKANARATDVKLTNNHKTITKKQETINKTLKRPDNVSQKTWDDFLLHRKNVKAPLTETALGYIQSQAKKASVSLEEALTIAQARGWRGFKSDWVINERDKKERNLLTQTYFEGEQSI